MKRVKQYYVEKSIMVSFKFTYENNSGKSFQFLGYVMINDEKKTLFHIQFEVTLKNFSLLEFWIEKCKINNYISNVTLFYMMNKLQL